MLVGQLKTATVTGERKKVGLEVVTLGKRMTIEFRMVVMIVVLIMLSSVYRRKLELPEPGSISSAEKPRNDLTPTTVLRYSGTASQRHHKTSTVNSLVRVVY